MKIDRSDSSPRSVQHSAQTSMIYPALILLRSAKNRVRNDDHIAGSKLQHEFLNNHDN